MEKWQIALSTVFWDKGHDEKVFEECAKNGIKAVEITCSELSYAEEFQWEELKRLSDKYGVELWSYHLPFAPFKLIDPSFEDEEKRQFTVKTFTELAEKAARVGVKNFVIHASGEPIPEDRREARLKKSKKSFEEMAEAFAKFGGRPLVEDLPRTCLGNCSAEIEYIISGDDRIGVVFDTNHLLFEDNTVFAEKLGKRIVSTHFSDYDFTDEKHMLPGEGKIDFPALMKALDISGYEGPVLYEISRFGFRGVDRETPLTIEDMKVNHSELVGFKTPTAKYICE